MMLSNLYQLIPIYYKTRQFYYKTGHNLLQNAAACLLQNGADFITKRGRYYKTGQFYYKTRQVLQNAAVITKRGRTTSTNSNQHKTGDVFRTTVCSKVGELPGDLRHYPQNIKS